MGRIWERSGEDLSGTRCLLADYSLRELLAERSFPASYLLLAQRAFTLSLATQILLLLLLLLRPFRPSRAPPFTSAFKMEGRFGLSDSL